MIFFALTVILFATSLVFHVSKSREQKRNIIAEAKKGKFLKWIILFLSILLIVLFYLNVKEFSSKQPSAINLVLINISAFNYVASLTLFFSSLINKEKYVVELDYPSRSKSRKGDIRLGKVVYKTKAKHPFLLEMSDLQQHMFISGTTGSGKSNFMQYFLLNFD